MSDPTVFTPYSNIVPFITENPEWAPETEQERVASYQFYDELYWSFRKALKLAVNEGHGSPIYIPTPRVIVDSTAHFLLKGLQIVPKKPAPNAPIVTALENFLTREKFYSRFHTNKHAGVRRGDFVFHMTVDPTKPAGSRVSLTILDPAEYFPIWDDDDIDKLIGVDLVKQWQDDSGRPRIHRLRYSYEYTATGRRVWVEEGIYEVEGWWKGKAAKVVARIQDPYMLPPEHDTIPVWHLQNIEDVGNPFGSSELRGFERLVAGINQSMTDEELALALQGLGVYATDSPPPKDDDGNEVPWVLTPGTVLETTGSFFKRVEGLSTVTPVQDHVKFLVESLYEGGGVFRSGSIDVQVAESGVALAIKFLPTLAKIEQRDLTGMETLRQLFYNWKKWYITYEGLEEGGVELDVILGSKLPESRKEKLNELNNMFDRKVISAAYYRAEMEKLGYTFPDNMQLEIIEEQRAWMELNAKYRQPVSGVQEDGTSGNPDANQNQDPKNSGNDSNNKSRPNESAGTEAG